MNTHTFANGMRLVHISSPTNVAYCGIAIDAGSRDEQENEYGIAHLCEHMMFKGTAHRKAWHIINRMESVGGDLNAYTNKEETVVYAAFMKEHLARAIELIADVVFNSTYPQHELDKEREVVIDEIESYNDSPAELIFDRFENMIYENHPLGHDILGSPENIRKYTSENLERFVRRLYRPERMVVFVFGNYSFKHVLKVVGKYCSDISIPEPPVAVSSQIIARTAPMIGTAQSRCENMNTHQAHVMLGTRSYHSDDERRIALYFLNNIIGGPGMNSRLNIALREHHGLVYTVESGLTNYTDTGTFSIYFGCDANDVEYCLRLIRRELDRLMSAPLSDRQFNACLKQLKGQIGVACDNFENYILDIAKCYLHYNKVEGIEDTFRQLSKLTPERVHKVAQDILRPENLSMIVFGSNLTHP